MKVSLRVVLELESSVIAIVNSGLEMGRMSKRELPPFLAEIEGVRLLTRDYNLR